MASHRRVIPGEAAPLIALPSMDRTPKPTPRAVQVNSGTSHQPPSLYDVSNSVTGESPQEGVLSTSTMEVANTCRPSRWAQFIKEDITTKVRRVSSRARTTPRSKLLGVLALFFFLNVTQNMIFLGQNFWLWSFPEGVSSAYVSMFVPAACWVVLDLLLLVIYTLALRPSNSTRSFFHRLFGGMCCGSTEAQQPCPTIITVEAPPPVGGSPTRRHSPPPPLEPDGGSVTGLGFPLVDGGATERPSLLSVANDSIINIAGELVKPRTSSTFHGHHLDAESLARHVTAPFPKELEVIDDGHPSRKNFDVFSFWMGDHEGILILVVIGMLDATAGMLSAYSVQHVPVVLQLTLNASSTIVTYLFHRLLYRQTALPMSWILALAFTFLLIGVACAIAPQVLAGGTWNTYLNVPWLLLYVLSVICPCIYMVLQGRFLSRFQDKVNPESAKIAVLTGDFCVQLVITICYFPLDFAPWFGMQSDAGDSWSGFVEGVRCLLTCRWTGLYFLVYTFGFFGGRIIGLFLSLYSPTMQAFLNQLCAPVTSLLLILFPILNVYGAEHSLAWSLASFACLCVSPVLYLIENEAKRDLDEETLEVKRQQWLAENYRDTSQSGN